MRVIREGQTGSPASGSPLAFRRSRHAGAAAHRQRELEACHFLPDRKRNRFGTIACAGSREVGNRVRKGVGLGAVAFPGFSRRGSDRVGAWIEVADAKLADVIGGVDSGGDADPASIDIAGFHRFYPDARVRVAELVEDPPGDDRAAREREVDVLQRFARIDVDAASRFTRPN